MALGAPASIVLPPTGRHWLPGGYWLRPRQSTHLVGPVLLRQALDKTCPQLAPGPDEARNALALG